MSKRNIAYIKPQDPKFLAQLKQQIGYKEGPSVETKRQKLEEDFDSDTDTEDRPEREDEKPQIVVIKKGDLTAEEVAAEETRLAKEVTEAPADLNQPIVFRKRHKPTDDSALEAALSSSKTTKSEKKNKDKSKSSKKSSNSSTAKLSFNAEDDEEGEEVF